MKNVALRSRADAGFTLLEAVFVLAVLAIAVSAGAILFRKRMAADADALRMRNIKSLQRSMMAAAQQSLRLEGCISGDPLSRCRICAAAGCRETGDLTASYLPRGLFAPDHARSAACHAASGEPCAWAIEQDGPEPLSLDRFRIRFFLERGTDTVFAPGMHAIDSGGVVE